MSLKKLRAGLLGSVLVFAGLVVPMATAEAAPSSPVSVCAVAGKIFVTAAGQIPPGKPFGGAYDFGFMAFVCVSAWPVAGTGLTGTALASSSGSTGTSCATEFIVLFSQFCGTYSVGPFLSGKTCNGRVGGPGIWNNPPQPGPWSLTIGPVITGWIDCGYPGLVNGGTAGAIALVAVPTSLNTAVGGGPLPLPSVPPLVGSGEACPNSGPYEPMPVIGGPAPVGPQAWFCALTVAGVAVIAG